MYADDLILLSSSIIELQKMLDICAQVGKNICLDFNPAKSKCLTVGYFLKIKPKNLSISNFDLPWVDNLEYLGISISSGKSFNVDFSNVRKKFFASVNNILSKCSFTSELVKLSLLEAHALPILLYAVESLNLSAIQLSELNSWWNSVYRKIFNYNRWESVRLLICLLGRLDFIHLCNLKMMKFISTVRTNNYEYSSPFHEFFHEFYFNTGECYDIFIRNDCDFNLSHANLKHNMYRHFNLSCLDLQ